MAYAQAHRLPLPSDPSSSHGPTLSFDIDPSKLNPSFEAYKLVQDDASTSSRSYDLPFRPPRLTDIYHPHGTQRYSGEVAFTGLGLKQTKERALHQILVPSSGPRRADEPFAAYIDADWFLFVLTYDTEKDKVTAHPVRRLVQMAGLPSLASLSPTSWLALDGESLILIELQKLRLLWENGALRWCEESSKRWTIPDLETIGTIKACKRMGNGKARILVQNIKTAGVAGKEKAKEGMQGLGYPKNDQEREKEPKASPSGYNRTTFEVRLIEVDCTDAKASTKRTDRNWQEQLLAAKVLWTVSGGEPLIMAEVGEQGSILCAEAPFVNIDHEARSTDVVSKPQTSASSESAPPAASLGSKRRAPHFSWAQTGDTVTIAFALPIWITKSHIRAHFSPGALSLSFTQEALSLLNVVGRIAEIDGDRISAAFVEDDDLTSAARMIASGRYVSRSTWAEIDPTGSLWTVERAREMTLLTLHLEKRHEGTRWMQVFANRTDKSTRGRVRNHADVEIGDKSKTQLSFQQARAEIERVATSPSSHQEEENEEEDAEDNEDDVPETMDPSELITMLEGMQKYTVDEESNEYGQDRTGFHSSNAGGQSGGTSLSLDQPSLLKDNLEEEDANVGRNFVVSLVAHSSSDSVDIHTSKNGETTMLATSLPGSSHESAVVIAHDLDGAIFTMQPEGRSWEHTATMPALAFVLASKRDAQRVHVHKRSEGGWVVLAFESAPQVTGSGEDNNATASGAGNLFVYYSPSSAGAKHAQSRVVRLGANGGIDGEDGEEASGALLGVCSVLLPPPGGRGEEKLEETLVCLCENRILMLRGLL